MNPFAAFSPKVVYSPGAPDSAARKPIRQGDMLLIPVDSFPVTGYRRRSDIGGAAVIGHGEHTGHKHVIDMAEWVVPEAVEVDDLWDFAENGNNDTGEPFFVITNEPTTLEHRDADDVVSENNHGTATVAPGVWEVRRQRTYAPTPERRERTAAVYD